MTTHLNKQRLLDGLESRIAALTAISALSVNHELAAELSRLKRSIDAGNFDIEAGPVLNQHIAACDDVATTAQQDPLEELADRIIGSSKLMDAMREIAIGDVVSVETILYRRAAEHEKQAAMIRDRRVEMREALQGLLSVEQQEGTESESEDAPRLPHNAIGRRLEYEEYVRSCEDSVTPMTFAQYFAALNGRR